MPEGRYKRGQVQDVDDVALCISNAFTYHARTFDSNPDAARILTAAIATAASESAAAQSALASTVRGRMSRCQPLVEPW